MNLTKKAGSLIPLLVLIGIVFLKIILAQPLESFSLKVFDQFQRLKPRVYNPETPAALVDIDDASLTKLGQWPWPRTLVARLFTKLTDSGAAAVVFDIVFAEPDRTSPGQVAHLLPEAPGKGKKCLASQPDQDPNLAKALEGKPAVTGFILTSGENGVLPALKTGFAYSGDDPKNFLPSFKGAVVNLPNIEKSAAGNGSFNFLAERDSIIRRVPVVFRIQDKLFPSLVMESLRVAQGASGMILKSSGASGETGFGEKTGILSIKTGNMIIPTDGTGKIWLYDSGHKAERFIPAWKVLEKDFDPKMVEGKIIFIGSSAGGLKDLRATPLNPVSAGTEIHVQLAEQVMEQNFLSRPDWASGAETVYVFLLGLILVFLLPRLGALACAVLSILFIAGAFIFSWHAFTAWRLLLDPVVPSLASLIIYLAASLLNYLRSENERRHIRGAFSRYLAPEIVKQLEDKPDQLKLGGEMKEMTVLFADIRGFTTFSERYSAQELTHFMNRFLTPMTDIILKNKGTIDKYMGDCIMAFWNAPLEDKDHAVNACRAAAAMQDHLKLWNLEMAEEAKNQAKSFQPIELAIGINTGKCCVGNMGSDQRFDYSVLGDEVNLASRLQGLSGFYGASILVSESTALAVKNQFEFVEVDLIQVKGKTKPVRALALAGAPGTEQEAISLFLKFLDKYRGRHWQEAEAVLDIFKGDFTYLKADILKSTFRERTRSYQTFPPPQGWNGVFIADSK